MNSSNVGNGLYLAESVIPDPGNGKSIIVEKSLAICNLRTAAAETRTLPRPFRQGVYITLSMQVDNGDCVVTVTGGFNAAGNTVLTFANVKEFATLQSFQDSAGVYYWRLLGINGAVPSMAEVEPPSEEPLTDVEVLEAKPEEELVEAKHPHKKEPEHHEHHGRRRH